MRTFLALTLVWLLLASNAVAQFTGSTTTGRTSTVEQARNARVDTYVFPKIRVTSFISLYKRGLTMAFIIGTDGRDNLLGTPQNDTFYMT